MIQPAATQPEQRMCASPLTTLPIPALIPGVIPLHARVPSGFVRVWVPGTTEAQVLRESISQFFLTEDWGRPDSEGAWIETQQSGQEAGEQDRDTSRPGFGVSWQAGSGTSGRPGLGTPAGSDFGTSGRPGLGTSGRPGLGTSGRPGLGTSGRPGLGTSGRPGLGTSGRPGLGTSGRPGLGTSGRPGLGRRRGAWGANRRALGAPMGSSDGQVTIFNRRNVLDDTGTLSLEALAVIPDLPEWLTPVGRGYRFVANSQAPRSIVFNYLQREAPPGYEHALALYFSSDEGRSWQELATELNPEENTATASATESGLYALAASVDLPFYTGGWNLFAYPLPESRPVTEALKSIAGNYTTIFAYDDNDRGDAWSVFDATAPAWVSDLSWLEYGRGYWINIAGPVTPTHDQPLVLRMKVPGAAGEVSASAPAQPGPAAGAGRRTPPAVYYGSIEGAAGVAEGTRVVALVDGVACGAGTVAAGDKPGELRYVLKVFAAEPGVQSDCGLPGKVVVFKLGEVNIEKPQPWDNSSPIRYDLTLR